MNGLTSQEIYTLSMLPIFSSGMLHDIHINTILELEIRGFVKRSLVTGTGGTYCDFCYIPTKYGDAVLNLLGEHPLVKRYK